MFDVIMDRVDFTLDLERCYPLRRPLLLATLWSLLGFGLAFSVTSFDAAGKCYVSPCAEGSGIDVMYRVSNGLSFQVIFTGFIFILQPTYGLWFVYKRCSPMIGAGFIGATMVTVVMSLMTAVLWGSEALMVDNLIDDYHGGIVNKTTRPAFTALSTLASFIFVLGVINTFLLVVSTDHFCDNVPMRNFANGERSGMGNGGITYQGVSILTDEDASLSDSEDI